MSNLGEVAEVTLKFEEFIKVLDNFLDTINPENNSLPADGLHQLAIIKVDCELYRLLRRL